MTHHGTPPDLQRVEHLDEVGRDARRDEERLLLVGAREVEHLASRMTTRRRRTRGASRTHCEE